MLLKKYQGAAELWEEIQNAKHKGPPCHHDLINWFPPMNKKAGKKTDTVFKKVSPKSLNSLVMNTLSHDKATSIETSDGMLHHVAMLVAHSLLHGLHGHKMVFHNGLLPPEMLAAQYQLCCLMQLSNIQEFYCIHQSHHVTIAST